MLRRRPPLPTDPVRAEGSLAAERAKLLASVGPSQSSGSGGSLPATELGAAAADAADSWLRKVYAQAIGDIAGVALLAVGGLGRRDLMPGSDLDLLIVHDGRSDIAKAAERLWYPIWDDGQSLDHSVRTLGELQKAADSDLRVALGLLDMRPIAGDELLASKAKERVDQLWETRVRRWLPEVMASANERREADEPVAFMLEPDLKEGYGGLRDANLLRSIARVAPVIRPGLDSPEVGEALDTMRQVLVALALVTPGGPAHGRNRLMLQDQDAVAKEVGAADADILMRDVAAAGRTVAFVSDDAWQRAQSWLRGPLGRNPGADRRIGPNLVLRDGDVALAAGSDAASDPSVAFRAAAEAVEHRTHIARSTLDRFQELAADGPPTTPPEGMWAGLSVPTPWPPAMRDSLLRLLALGHRAIVMIETLDQRGILTRLMPEWEPVQNRPQRNAFHRYTVDRHLLEAAAEAARLTTKVDRPDLLLAGALLHDIGKGQPGDHSEVGATIAVRLALRMGFSPTDVETIGRLVRHHLLLPDTATRRDLDDPATIDVVTSAVGDRRTLSLLAALCEADSIATGPTAWGDWKTGLVRRLVVLSDERLAGAVGENPEEGQRGGAEIGPIDVSDLIAAGKLAMRAEGRHVTVVGPDDPGLFSSVAGVLALHDADVRSALAGSVGPAAARGGPAAARGGRVGVSSFEVEPSFGELPDWQAVYDDLKATREGRLRLGERLADKQRSYHRRVQSRRDAAKSATTPVIHVRFDDEASRSATVIDVRAPDAPAVLSMLLDALFRCGLDITQARVASLGAEAIDVFYVRHADESLVVNMDERQEIEREIRRTLRGSSAE